MTTHPNGAMRWQTWAAVAAVALAFFGSAGGGIYWLSTLNSTVQNLVRDVSAIDRTVTRLSATNAIHDTDLTALKTTLAEIETQFCGVSRDVNLMHANELRLFSLLWSKVYQVDLPVANAYYPEFGKCK